MKHNLESIKCGKVNLPPRILLLGTPKVGKTTFACGSTKPILIPVRGEEGADDMDVAKFPTVDTYAELLESLGTLANEKHDYKTLIIDSASTLEPLVWDYTVANATATKAGPPKSIEEVGGGFMKGYIEALKHWRKVMDGLDYLRANKGMASIIIGHVMVKQFNDPMSEPYDQFMWNVHHKAAATFIQWADCILFAKEQNFVKVATADMPKNAKNKATGAGVRKLYTQTRPAHPGGGRGVYGRLDYELDLEWSAFIKEVKEKMK